MDSLRIRFWILTIIVLISGLSQGMLLPLIAVILENDGVSSTINGLHATGLYIGVLLASPLMEGPLRKFGYKPLIVVGGLMVIISLFSFTIWESLWFWFILRLLIGIGDHALHFATQTWITSFSAEHVRGRNISLYGLFYGIGFAIGPLMAQLVSIDENLPFFVAGGFSLLAWSTVYFIKNEKPTRDNNEIEVYTIQATFGRFASVIKYAWAPLLPAFCYGVLEASLNSNLPVYGMRAGMEVETVTFIITCFFTGAIVFQLPLGMISDRFGRRKILLFIMSFGTLTFLAAALFENSMFILSVLLFIAGMLLGSTFSLSIAYVTDILPKPLLPAGNLIIGIAFSFGSISGPFLGGLAIEYLNGISFFYLISFILFLIFIGIVVYKKKNFAEENQLKTGLSET